MLVVLKKNHYQPHDIDNDLSRKICRNYINALDPYDLIFTSNDKKEFAKFNTCLVKKDNLAYCGFLSSVFATYRVRLSQADSIINLLSKISLEYNKKEDFIFNFQDTLSKKLDKSSLRDRWRKYIKYQMLDYVDVQNDIDSERNFKSFLDQESELREKVILKEKCRIKRILNHPSGFESFLTSIFLNEIAVIYDPHTMFFLPDEKDNFEISLSKKAKSFGLAFSDDEDGEIRIENLVPGGPAWKSNILNGGDIILEIRKPDNTLVDISCIDMYTLHTILQSAELNTIELKVRKNNGQIKTVKLYKEELFIEENKISSFILDGEIKIGYINLPGFYTNWEQEYTLGCANDVAKEILKLKKEQIEGLILDVRNNGGGSVAEAMDLAGIFIDSGPLSVYKEKNVKPRLIKDINRGTIYDGPLVLLVNKLSASASEFLAAVLQDYNRAIIVGSTTYGKATGQVIIPNDTSYTSNSINQTENTSAQGYLKITNSKFYRVNQKSFQKTGVIPDVVLPDILDYYNVGEASNLYALKNDTIIKKVYYNALPSFPIDELQKLSAKRTELNTNFKMIKSLEETFKRFTTSPEKISLYRDSLINRIEESGYLFQAIEGLNIPISDRLIVKSNDFDRDLIEIDQNKMEINKKIIEDISNDIYIVECLKILNDLITIKQENGDEKN
ncbi:MAG: carboxy terminal-processing peptidase [Bacteroidales bacterium]|nr:carboxy terminal-processing peptidase [Bacteroidales bacterium]